MTIKDQPLTGHYALNVLINTIVGNHTLRTRNDSTALQVASAQCKLIQDELDELKEGIATKNIMEVRDGLGDVLVTVDGLIHRLGLKHWEIPNDLTGVTAAVLVNTPEDLLGLLTDHLHSMLQISATADTEYCLNELHHQGFALRCHEMVMACYKLADIFGIDILADQKAIFDSNLSKFDTDLKVAAQGVTKYADLGIAAGIYPNEVGGITYYVLKCMQTATTTTGKLQRLGKFMKSIHFKEPVLTPLADTAPIFEMLAPEMAPLL